MTLTQEKNMPQGTVHPYNPQTVLAAFHCISECTWMTLRRSEEDLPVPLAKLDSSTASLPVVDAMAGRLQTRSRQLVTLASVRRPEFGIYVCMIRFRVCSLNLPEGIKLNSSTASLPVVDAMAGRLHDKSGVI